MAALAWGALLAEMGGGERVLPVWGLSMVNGDAAEAALAPGRAKGLTVGVGGL